MKGFKNPDAHERCQIEKFVLYEKLSKARALRDDPDRRAALSDIQACLLHVQINAMATYYAVLSARLEFWEMEP